MSPEGQVILVSLWFVGVVAAVVLTIWGPMAEWNYNLAMRPVFRWMYPTKLREKAIFVRFQKGMAWFGLFFLTLVYVGALVSILSHR
jgi:hypothetical protein